MHKFHFATKLPVLMIFAFALALMPLACTGGDHDHVQHADEHPDHDDGDHDSHDHEEHAEAGHEGHGHEGHDHGGEDLEKSPEELFGASCEHGIKTYECEECRYEVGVVKVPHDLIDRGLIAVTEVTPRDFDSEVGLTGEIQFDNQKVAHIGPRVSGIVRQVKVDIGQQVKAGQTLAIVESVELAEAEAEYLEALAERRLMKKAFDRKKSLHDQKIVSERDYLEAQQQHESALIRESSAKQKLLRMGLYNGSVAHLAKVGHLAANGYLPVTAPFAGKVMEMHAVRGEHVEPGGEMILLGDPSTLWVWVDLYESQLAQVRQNMGENGLPVSLTVRAWPGESFNGWLDFIGGTMNEQTRTVKARVTLDNPQGKLKPGMFADVRLGLNSAGGRLSAPETAVVSDEGHDFVFVRQMDDYFLRRPVTKGREADGFVELLDGVQQGQTVVVAGTFLLKSDVLRSKMGAGCAH